jgi:hypothetical protein
MKEGPFGKNHINMKVAIDWHPRNKMAKEKRSID